LPASNFTFRLAQLSTHGYTRLVPLSRLFRCRVLCGGPAIRHL